MQSRPGERTTRARDALLSVAIGAVAGVGSGLLGVGGGIVMVPLLTAVLAFGQHRAHATSLAAIVPIAAVGAAKFAIEGHTDLALAGALAAGAIVGAPLGARLMARSGEGLLKTLFGVLMLAVAAELLWP
jgi:uncharacterized membrane protein YfcA